MTTMSAAEFTRRSGVSRRTIDRYVKRGHLKPTVDVDGKTLFTVDDLAYVDATQQQRRSNV